MARAELEEEWPATAPGVAETIIRPVAMGDRDEIGEQEIWNESLERVGEGEG